MVGAFNITQLDEPFARQEKWNGIYVRSQCVKKLRLRDGDIIMSGKREVPYKDPRLSDSD